MTAEDIIKAAKLFPKERRAKAIKVSEKFYYYIKNELGAPPEELLKKIPKGFMGGICGIPVVIDKDVETYEIEYEK